GAERETVRSRVRSGHGGGGAAGFEAVHIAAVDLDDAAIALFGDVDPVAGVGEPDAAVARDDQVVGGAEPQTLVPVREDLPGPVVLASHHGALAVAGAEEATLGVDGVAVLVVRGFEQDPGT